MKAKRGTEAGAIIATQTDEEEGLCHDCNAIDHGQSNEDGEYGDHGDRL